MNHKDIVARLRDVSGWPGDNGDGPLCWEAADAIDALRTTLSKSLENEGRLACRAGALQFHINQMLSPEEREAITNAICWIESPGQEDDVLAEDYEPITSVLRLLLSRTEQQST